MDFLSIPVFIFGAMVGSFLNVFLLRGGTGKWRSGRSVCFSCGKTIEPIDMIPILSYFFLKGRCRFCKSKISFQYPLVELLNGLLFLLIFYIFFTGFNFLVILNILVLWSIMSLLLLICFYDIKHKIIPTGPQFLLYFFTLLKIILDYFIGGDTKSFVWAFLGGILASLPFFLMWFFSKGKWIGFGDVKLALPLGWFVGFQFIIQSILISYIIGGVSIVIFSLLKKFFPKVLSYFGLDTLKLNRKTEVPFAPFLIAGFTLMFFFPSVTYYLFPFLM